MMRSWWGLDHDDENYDDEGAADDNDNKNDDDGGNDGTNDSEQSGVAGVCSSSRDRLTMIDDKHATDRWWWWLQCWHTQGIERGINALDEIDNYVTDQRKGKNGKLCSQAPTLELERCQKSLCLFHISIR